MMRVLLLSLLLLTPKTALANPWGVAVGLYPEEARKRGFEFPPKLEEIRALGAKHILLTVSLRQIGADGSEVFGDKAVDDSLLEEIGRRAAQEGLGVSLMPIIEIDGGGPTDWRGRLRPRDPDAWWRSYGRWIRHYAGLAQKNGFAHFVMASELSSMSVPSTSQRWQRLRRDVRQVYRGKIAVVANHDALDLVTPFEYADVVGVSAYFPLSSRLDASEEELSRSWQRISGELEKLAARIKKPLILFEVGYPSIDGGAVVPWDYTIGAPIDLEEQRRAYAASIDTILASPWISGAFFWTWFGPGGQHDRYYTPRGKPAEQELRRLFRNVGWDMLAPL